MLHQKDQNHNQSPDSCDQLLFGVKQLNKVQKDASAFIDIQIGGFLQQETNPGHMLSRLEERKEGPAGCASGKKFENDSILSDFEMPTTQIGKSIKL